MTYEESYDRFLAAWAELKVAVRLALIGDLKAIWRTRPRRWFP